MKNSNDQSFTTLDFQEVSRQMEDCVTPHVYIQTPSPQ